MMDEADEVQGLRARVVELEIRSAEQARDVATLEAFVAGYEARVAALEAEVRRLRATITDGTPGPLPDPADDAPPHY